MSAAAPASAAAGPRTAPPRALLLANPKACHAAAGADAIGRLRDAGMALVEVESAGRDEVGRIVRDHAGSVDCVIVGGGDGSLNAAAAGLADTGLPLGILPLGTANDLARTLGIGFDPVAAADIILGGHRRTIDLGDANGFPFFNVASVGFSARLVRELRGEEKRRWGVLGYALAAARLLFRARPFHAEFEVAGDRVMVKTMQISVGNGRFYGGGMTVDRDARPDDGLLDVYSLEIGHWLRLLALAPMLRLGLQAGRAGVRTFRTDALTVRTRHVHDVDLDGDLVTTTPCRFGVRPRAVTVFVPPPAV